MIIQTKELAQIRDALELAKARIEYLGAACTNPKHFESNRDHFIPTIDAALALVGRMKDPQ